MPYHAHPFFNEPSPDNARLWRYMDLAQFLSILEKQALFFPSVATLAKADPYEGEPLPTKLRAAQARGAAALHAFRLNCEVFKHLNFYNCWHMNDSESDAMWKVYLKGSQGIAIQSTVARIKSSLQNCLTDEIYMALVKYVDYDTFEATADTYSRSDYMFKRLAFRHEQEVRLGTSRDDVCSEFVDDDTGRITSSNPHVTLADILMHPERTGVYVPISISALVERVVIYPFAPVWFSELVTSLSKRLGYGFEVVSSEMARPSPLSVAWKI